MSEINNKQNYSAENQNLYQSTSRDNFDNQIEKSAKSQNENSYTKDSSLLKKCRDSIENMHVEIEEERKLRQDLQKDFVKLETDQNNSIKELKQCKIELCSICEENNSLQSILGSQKAKVSELSYANAQLESDLSSLKEYEDANSNLASHNEELTQINSELKQRLEELDQEFNEKDIYFDNLARKVDDIEKANKNLKLMNSDLDIENSDLKSRIERLEVQNKISDQLRQQLIKSKDHYERLIEQAKVDLDQRSIDMEREFDLKECELKKKQKDIDNQNKKEMLNTITAIQKDLEDSNLGYEKIKIANNDLRNEVKTINAHNRSLKQELDMKDSQTDKTINEINNKQEYLIKNITDEADNLRNKLDRLTNDQENKNLTVLKLEESMKELKSTIDNEKAYHGQKSSATQGELKWAKDRIKELEMEIEDKNNTIINKNGEYNQFKEKQDDEYQIFNNKVNTLESNVGQLRMQLQEKDSALQTLSQKMNIRESEQKDVKNRWNNNKLRESDVIKDYEAKLLDMKTKCNDKLRESDQKAFQTESQLNKIKADQSLLRSTLDKLTNESQGIKYEQDQKISNTKQKQGNKYTLLKEYVKKEFENIRIMLSDQDRVSKNMNRRDREVQNSSQIDRNIDMSNSQHKRFDEQDNMSGHGSGGPYSIGQLNQINKVMDRMEHEIDDKNM